MTRLILDQKLNEISQDVSILEEMVKQAMLSAVSALKERDINTSKHIYEADIRINEKRYAIEHECITTIATQQPLAVDLRILASILEVSTELERMGDYAKGIAKINLLLKEEELLEQVGYLPEMAEMAVSMLDQAVRAFTAQDMRAAEAIPQQDDEVDRIYNALYRDLMEYVMKHPESFDQANLLMWAAHNIERMADRVTNICERTLFICTGEIRELDVSLDELLSR